MFNNTAKQAEQELENIKTRETKAFNTLYEEIINKSNEAKNNAEAEYREKIKKAEQKYEEIVKQAGIKFRSLTGKGKD